MRPPALPALALLFLLTTIPATGQDRGQHVMLQGMVWTPPEDPAEVLSDLQAMSASGVQAVRMPAGDRPDVLLSTARQGLAIYLDLPIEALPATRLVDTLSFAERHLEEVLQMAAGNPNVLAIGLASAVDTSVPLACRYFEQMAERVRAAGLQAYYRTRFIESDVCSAAVDFVMLDARGREADAVLARWRRHHETPAAIGYLGTQVDDRVQSGHLTPRSPAAQARYLERNLRTLMRADEPPVAVFVHRWKGPSFGLLDPDATPRLALQVVQGIYTGRQMVFAIDAGPEPAAPPGAPSFSVIGWIIAILLVLLLALAPRFRDLIPRYFERHIYYRESVQRSIGLEGFASMGFALALALSAGLIIGVVLHAAAGTDVLEVAVSGLAEARQEAVLSALRNPLISVLGGALLYILWVVLNMSWMRLLAGKKHRVRPGQAAVLTSFSRWQLFPLAVLALVAVQSPQPLLWVPWLLGLWLLVEAYAGIRMLYDYGLVTRVPMPRAIVAGVGVPLLVGIALVAGVALAAGPEVTFLWHLATRT